MERGKSVNIPSDLYDAIAEIGAENEGATVPYLIRKVMREWINKNPTISITRPTNRPLPPDPGIIK